MCVWSTSLTVYFLNILRLGFECKKNALTRFSTNTSECNAVVGGKAGVNICFPHNNLILLWPIDAKLGV